MEEGEEWRDEPSAGECGSQSIPLFARALTLLNSFHESLFPDQSDGPEPDPLEQLVDAPPGRSEEEIRSLKKSRSKNWTRTEMLKLVSLRGGYDARFAGGGKKLELWEEISEALRAEGVSRDAQQCRDKWEKLGASYKEVRDGGKLREDFPLFDVLHPLLSGRKTPPGKKMMLGNGGLHAAEDELHPQGGVASLDEDEVIVDPSVVAPPTRSSTTRKKRRILKCVPVTEVTAVQSLLETVVTKQQKFFRDLLESMDRREQLREQIRQEREEQWRAEDRAQRLAFDNAMIFLASKLQQQPGSTMDRQQVTTVNHDVDSGQKRLKRSKNWKRAEVLQLIRLRSGMEAQFSSGTKRAAVWEELAEALAAQGVARDGKQCREKWDKLTSGFKDVSDGVKEASDLPCFEELAAALRKPGAFEDPRAVVVDNGGAPNS